MKRKYFEGYGFLNWLDPAEYFAGSWTYVGYADDDCEEIFDLVRNKRTMEMRYTTI